jgi:hypothetical protein
MNDVTIVDVFFILTGAAVVIITVLLVIGLVYVILFIRTARSVAKKAVRATEIVADDLSDLRETIKEKGVSLGAVADFTKKLGRKKIYPKKNK